MEQEEHEKNQQAQPLYYIEQPALTPFSGPGQSISIQKNIGAQKRKKHVTKRDKQPKNREKDAAADTGEVEEEEILEEEKEEFKDGSSNKTVEELLEYIESLPHFIQPVIACETEEQYIQGTIVDVADGSITFQDRRNFMNTVIQKTDITNMHIVSL
ncbi:hypothetical protein [Salibacterium aidingense]|uniref:hypothetical protein n=1 Tax=Salibacterium aidingense TaxID=384933 RepID=UPI0003F54368|nr:hypothetical protein [Salibacterium aidingense]